MSTSRIFLAVTLLPIHLFAPRAWAQQSAPDAACKALASTDFSAVQDAPTRQ
jgi:hypothetical protein